MQTAILAVNVAPTELSNFCGTLCKDPNTVLKEPATSCKTITIHVSKRDVSYYYISRTIQNKLSQLLEVLALPSLDSAGCSYDMLARIGHIVRVIGARSQSLDCDSGRPFT